jgi:hypothetical protein
MARQSLAAACDAAIRRACAFFGGRTGQTSRGAIELVRPRSTACSIGRRGAPHSGPRTRYLSASIRGVVARARHRWRDYVHHHWNRLAEVRKQLGWGSVHIKRGGTGTPCQFNGWRCQVYGLPTAELQRKKQSAGARAQGIVWSTGCAACVHLRTNLPVSERTSNTLTRICPTAHRWAPRLLGDENCYKPAAHDWASTPRQVLN